MTGHPRERRGGMSRRDFLRRSGGTAVALSSASWILQACGDRPGTNGGNGGPTGFEIARPEDPVTLPEFEDNAAIESDLEPEKGATLQIFNWEAYVWPQVVKDFCAEYDCDFEITTFNNMDEGVAKLRTGQFNFDIFFPTIDRLGKLVAAKLLQPINHDYVPNLEANVWPVYHNPFYDQGWRYSVPYTVYTTGIGYRRDEITDEEVRAMDNPYDLIWDPRFAGKTGIYDDYREALSMALLRNGITDLNTTDPEHIELAKNDLIELIDAVNVRYSTNGAWAKLPEGEYHVHQAWSGDMTAAWFYVPRGTKPEVLGYWYPEDRRGSVGNDLIAIPSSAENPVLAHLFLNWLMDFDNSMKNFSWVGYQTPMVEADPDTLTTTKSQWGEPYVFPWLEDAVVREEDFSTGYMQLELTPDVDEMWQDAWEEFKAGAN